MLKYALKRLGLSVPLLFLLSILTFVYIQVIPGDPVAGMLGPGGSPALIKQLRHQLGLDQPIPSQYWHWLSNLFAHGDLGISFITQQPITPVLVARAGLPATLQLTVTGLIFTVALGWLGGFTSRRVQGHLGRPHAVRPDPRSRAVHADVLDRHDPDRGVRRIPAVAARPEVTCRSPRIRRRASRTA